MKQWNRKENHNKRCGENHEIWSHQKSQQVAFVVGSGVRLTETMKLPSQCFDYDAIPVSLVTPTWLTYPLAQWMSEKAKTTRKKRKSKSLVFVDLMFVAHNISRNDFALLLTKPWFLIENWCNRVRCAARVIWRIGTNWNLYNIVIGPKWNLVFARTARNGKSNESALLLYASIYVY